MRKFITLFIIGCLLFSGLNAVANSDESDSLEGQTFQQFFFSEPQIASRDEYISVTIPEQTACVLDEGKPMLPLISKTFAYPIGTIIQDVQVDCTMEEYTLTAVVEPAPMPVALHSELMKNFKAVTPDQSIYQSSDFYPEQQYDVSIGMGLYDEEHSVIVTVKCFSRYAPAENLLQVPSSIDIAIDYELPASPLTNDDDQLSMLIITDERFEVALQPLVDHKNQMGINTMLKTMQEILPQYNGVADWEDVKLCIKDHIEQYDIEFVMLAGGHVGNTAEWYVPDFRSNNYDNNGYEDGSGYMDITYSADLYFADVYRYDGSGTPQFEDWDTNNDGIYAEGPLSFLNGYDKPDFYPDVAVGRIPLRYDWQVPIIVDKIITYETTTYGQDWYHDAVFVAGDTSPYERYGEPVKHGIYEGEITCDNHANYLSQVGFEANKLYTSLGVRGVDDVAPVISEGCGWVNMQMHANPATGGNHITDLEEFARFYSFMHMDQFKNGYKLPFMINDGCHNAQFDVSIQKVLDHGGFGNINYNWYEWIPTDASSWFLLMEGGGAIGVIGNTALGYGYLNEYCSQGLGGWIMPIFARAHAVLGKEYPGTIWTQGMTDYISNFPVINDVVDRKTIEERGLLGDPSIKLGGYNIGTLDDDDGEDEEDPVVNTLGNVNKPEWELGMSWTYEINAFDFNFAEIEGRDVEFTIKTGEMNFEISEVTSSTYLAAVSTEDLEVFVDIDLDMFTEESQPIKLTAKMVNASITGDIKFDRNTIGMKMINLVLDGELVTETLLENIAFEVPPIVLKLAPVIPITMNIEVYFDEPYILFEYPMEIGNQWGIAEGTITVDGSIESPYFRIISIIDKIARIVGIQILPPEIAPYFPIIDLSEILGDFGIENEIVMPETPVFFDSEVFECRSEEEITVPAGTFTTYNVWFMIGAGEFFYSPDVQNVVKMRGNIDHYIPIIENIELDLVDYSLS